MTVADLTRTHALVAQADRRLARHAGQLRTSQNWIGSDPHTPTGAAFVPPPARMLGPLLEDLCAFCSRDDLSPMLRAAVAHAQFETLHPFVDGNGRAGRVLIGELLCRGGLAQAVVPPTSLVLAGLLGRSYESGRAAVAALEEDRVLRQVTLGRRNRAWECVGLFALVDDLECTLSDGAIRIAETH